MKKQLFVQACLPWAQESGEQFRLYPVVILAQAALESGWGTSTLSTLYHNFFGITGYGSSNDYWQGHTVQLKKDSLNFRTYASGRESFLDYGRLIRSAYPMAAEVSRDPAAFAREISQSKYISEVNGDNRALYRKSLVSLAKDIESILADTLQPVSL